MVIIPWFGWWGDICCPPQVPSKARGIVIGFPWCVVLYEFFNIIFLLQKLGGKRALWILLSMAFWQQGPNLKEVPASVNSLNWMGFGLSPLSCIIYLQNNLYTRHSIKIESFQKSVLREFVRNDGTSHF